MSLYLTEAFQLTKVLLWHFWRQSLHTQREVPKDIKINGKVCIVTGANTGIGYETALDLSRRGAHVIVTCRDDAKGHETVNRIKQNSNNELVEYMQLELGSLKSVRNFAEEFRSKKLPLHILINNAGIMNVPYQLTEDGFESQIGVNHLGHFLLTNLLLDIIKKSTPSKIINLTSSGHFGAVFNWDDMHFTNGYATSLAYFNSKCANVLFTKELAKRLEGTGVTVNAVHPGSVNTELARHSPSYVKSLAKYARTPYEGALTTLWVALSPEDEKVTGEFWSDCYTAGPSYLSLDEEVQKKMWDWSVKSVGLKQ